MNELFDDSQDFENRVAALLQDIYRKHHFDYRNYSQSFLSRRTVAYAKRQNFETVEALAKKILSDESELERFVDSLSLPTTRMFRDAGVFQQIRRTVIPYLNETQLDKVWCAGCSTGEEAYSVAIILNEETKNRKILTFATDFSEKCLHEAKRGIYPIRRMRAYTASYLASGGRADFSDYYSSDDENAMINAELKRNIVFAQHNLATDSSFNEFDLILCRNVLIYFNKQLQEHVLNLFYESLRPGGILILGDKESIRSIIPQKKFSEVDRAFRIFKRAE
jgi:chemotaxis protein methyltransferase CheR